MQSAQHADEVRKYRVAWQCDAYRHVSPAERRKQAIERHLEHVEVHRVADLGAGTGRLSRYLQARGYSLTAVDLIPEALETDVPYVEANLADPELRALVGPQDAIVCVDVLEHIPTEWVEAVVRNIRELASHGYVAIATFPDGFGPRLGLGPLHLTVESVDWWRQHFPEAELEGKYVVARY